MIEILTAYFAWISGLAVQRGNSSAGEVSIKDLVRARTLATLRMVQSECKTLLVIFLYEARMLGSQEGKKAIPLIALNDADLKGANLPHYQMDYVGITSAFLYQANLGARDLINVDLSYATPA